MNEMTLKNARLLSNDEIHQLIQDKLWTLERRIRPLRFLLSNYKSESCHTNNDREDILALGELLGDHLELIVEISEIAEYAASKARIEARSTQVH